MEGPSLVILREELKPFLRKRVMEVSGNTKIEKEVLSGLVLKEIRTWGKLLLMNFGTQVLRVHFLMFGSYRINQRKESPPRLSLVFRNGELNLYACSVQLMEGGGGALDEAFDWHCDPMGTFWNPALALRRVKKLKDEMVCDVLLNQNIFSGVGNIIKNEVLFIEKLHPATTVGELSPRKLKQLVDSTEKYCHQFYYWKKRYELKKNWKIYRKRKCPECGERPVFEKTGKLNRVSFYCQNCQHKGGAKASALKVEKLKTTSGRKPSALPAPASGGSRPSRRGQT